MKRFFDWFNNLYPVWLVTLAVIAFFKPPVMLWFAALVLHVIGFGIGYLIPKVLRYPDTAGAIRCRLPPRGKNDRPGSDRAHDP